MSLRKTDHGLMVFADPAADGAILEVKTLCCVHCGGHFPAKAPKDPQARFFTAEEARERQAAGKTLRGFCTRCCGPVCGPGCAECVPVEQYLENLEKGREENFRPLIVGIPNVLGDK